MGRGRQIAVPPELCVDAKCCSEWSSQDICGSWCLGKAWEAGSGTQGAGSWLWPSELCLCWCHVLLWAELAGPPWEPRTAVGKTHRTPVAATCCSGQSSQDPRGSFAESHLCALQSRLCLPGFPATSRWRWAPMCSCPAALRGSQSQPSPGTR